MSAPALPPAGADPAFLRFALRLNRRLDEPGVAARVCLRALPRGVSPAEFARLTAPIVDAPAAGHARPSDEAWAAEELALAERRRVFLVHWFDDAYPAALRAIPDPPLLLYGEGRRELLGRRDAVAVVGARNCNDYGRDVARLFASAFARAGRVVVSGLALGIDRAAHEAALAAGGDTLAVVGTGLDRPYPAVNAPLQRAIASRGLVVSEFPFGTPSEPRNFPLRNRIIAGLSEGVLVAQAAGRSGSLITARLAAEYGRDVLAVPGNVTSPLSAGVNRLLLDGAAPAVDPESALKAVGRLGAAPAASAAGVDNDSGRAKIPPRERAILDLVSAGALSYDELAERTGLPVHEISAAAARLEALGLATTGAGRRLAARR